MEKKFQSHLFGFHTPKKINDNYSKNKLLYQSNNERVEIKKIIRVKIDKNILNKKVNDSKNNNSLTENSAKINKENILNENNENVIKNKNEFSSQKLRNIYKIKKLIKERPISVNLDYNFKQKGRNIKSEFDFYGSKTEISKNNYKTKIASIKNFDKLINFKTIDNSYKNNYLLLSKTTCKTPINKKEKFKFFSPYCNKNTIHRKKNQSNLIYLMLNNILTDKNEIDNYRKNQFLNLKKHLKLGQNKIFEVFNELKKVQLYSDVCIKQKNYLLRNMNDINEKYGF